MLYVCKKCKTFHTEADAVCHGETVTPFEIALSYQEELFESAGDERALNVMKALRNEAEAAGQKVVTAQNKLPELIALRDRAEGVLLDFFKLTTGAPRD
jgi:hypothetical protein